MKGLQEYRICHKVFTLVFGLALCRVAENAVGNKIEIA